MIVLVHKKPGPGYKDVERLLFAPDSRALIAGGQLGGCIWEGLPVTDKKRELPEIRWMRSAQFASRNELFVGVNGWIRSINLTTLESKSLDPPMGEIENFDISTNRRVAVLVAIEPFSGPEPERWRVSCSPVTDLSATAVRWSRHFSSSVAVWCLDTNRFLLRTFESGLSHRYTINSLKTGASQQDVGTNEWFGSKNLVSPDGHFFVMMREAQLIAFSTSALSKPLSHLKNASRKLFTDIAFHPSGRYLAATSNDETVKLYDTATWEVAHTFTWKIGKMKSVAFSPDGALAAAGSDKGQVVVWDVDL